MYSTAEIMDRGIACLIDQMGVVDAEHFIATVKRENFDYTMWRRSYFGDMKPGQFGDEAATYANANPHLGKGVRL